MTWSTFKYTKADQMTIDGLLIVDKPTGWTSHDVVACTRRLVHTRRVGHAGTLDPMATGVLVIGINKATKLLTFLVGCNKIYTATIRLGQSTVTDDAEGEVTSSYDLRGLDSSAIDAAISNLTGDIQQVPSAVSAIKINGVRAYAKVHGGDEVKLPPSLVRIDRFELIARRESNDESTGLGMVELDIEVDVSSGTYIRALARDLGVALGVGGHLTALRRTGVGYFNVADAHPLDQLAMLADTDEALPIIPMGEAARAQFAVRVVTLPEARDLRHGKRLTPRAERCSLTAAVMSNGDLIAMLDESGLVPKSRVVFPG